jgi:hypothetical protein
LLKNRPVPSKNDPKLCPKATLGQIINFADTFRREMGYLFNFADKFSRKMGYLCNFQTIADSKPSRRKSKTSPNLVTLFLVQTGSAI